MGSEMCIRDRQESGQGGNAELVEFLTPLNAEALKSLHEAGDDLIALHCLGAPNTLHRNLLSTKAIENSFRTSRRKLGRVTRFRAETDQATRWLAFALLEVDKGYRRISGYADLPKLVAALEKDENPPPKISVGLDTDNQSQGNT